MKKNLIIIACLGLFATACFKKDRTCECTTTSSGTYTDSQGTVTAYSNDPETATTDYKKVKKSDIEISCGDSKYTNTSSSTSATGVKTTNTSTSETKCTIK